MECSGAKKTKKLNAWEGKKRHGTLDWKMEGEYVITAFTFQSKTDSNRGINGFASFYLDLR